LRRKTVVVVGVAVTVASTLLIASAILARIVQVRAILYPKIK
jgi:hypothetical protein